MEDASQTFFRENTVPPEVLRYRPEVDPKELLEGLTLKKLHEVFASVLKRQENKVDPIRSKFGKDAISFGTAGTLEQEDHL